MRTHSRTESPESEFKQNSALKYLRYGNLYKSVYINTVVLNADIAFLVHIQQSQFARVSTGQSSSVSAPTPTWFTEHYHFY